VLRLKIMELYANFLICIHDLVFIQLSAGINRLYLTCRCVFRS
jgi:hypothetical protein